MAAEAIPVEVACRVLDVSTSGWFIARRWASFVSPRRAELCRAHD
jgi:hypothetical protein